MRVITGSTSDNYRREIFDEVIVKDNEIDKETRRLIRSDKNCCDIVKGTLQPMIQVNLRQMRCTKCREKRLFY